jgi:hypothetical protein
MTEVKALTKADLRQLTRSEPWYRRRIDGAVLFFDGPGQLAETKQTSWLVNEIALAQHRDSRVAAEEFQYWRLIVKSNGTATLMCEVGDRKSVFTKPFGYIDFRLPEIALTLPSL